MYKELSRQGMEEDQIEKILMWLRGDSSAESQNAYINFEALGSSALSLYQSQAANKRNAHDVLF
ncbi:hypothetical protein D3C85_1700110 [compost metagenome]